MLFVRLLSLLLALLIGLGTWSVAAGTDDATPVPTVNTAPTEAPDRLRFDAPLDGLPNAPFTLRLSRYSYSRDSEFDFASLPGPLLLYVESGYLNVQVEGSALHLGAQNTADGGGEQRQLIPSARVTLWPGDRLVVPGPNGLSTRNVERGPSEILAIQFSAVGRPPAPASVPDGLDITVLAEATFPALFGGPAEVSLRQRTVAPEAISRRSTARASVQSARLVTVEAGSLGVSLKKGAAEIQQGEQHQAIPLGNAASPAATLVAGEGLLLASGAVAYLHNTGAEPVVTLNLGVTSQVPTGDHFTISSSLAGGHPPPLGLEPTTIQIPSGETRDFHISPSVDVTWSVEPTDGASIDPATGTLTIDADTPHGRVYTVRADVEGEPRELTTVVHVYTPEGNPLVGGWSEQMQLGCTGDEMAPAGRINNLVFQADGTFQVVWQYMELSVDTGYWGVYAYDLDQGTLELFITGGTGNISVPPDVTGNGTFALNAQGELVLSDLWLGSPRDGAEAACGHRFAPRTPA